MNYSLTERKRIRKSFAKRASVLQVPYLLATQIESYAAFLQADTLPEARRLQGLQVDILLQDELNHPSLFWINRRARLSGRPLGGW